jgi:MSHA biogenesis protein MshQ
LKNYQGSSTPAFSFAKPVTLADTTGKGLITMGGNSTVPVVAFSSGTALLNNVDANHPLAKFAFNTNPTQPSTIVIAATDSDSGAGSAATASASMRSGRLRMLNMYGSERLALAVPLEAQYWSGSYWTTNQQDSCTVVPMSSLIMGPYIGALAACNAQVSPTGSQTLNAGKLSLNLSKPTVSGSVEMVLNLGNTPSGSTCIGTTPSPATAAGLAWFGANPSARATFGVYKSPLIYLRENY